MCVYILEWERECEGKKKEYFQLLFAFTEFKSMSQDHKKGQLAFRSLKDDKRNVPSPKKKRFPISKGFKICTLKGQIQ